eukprot:157891-Amphidinium_carterae.1
MRMVEYNDCNEMWVEGAVAVPSGPKVRETFLEITCVATYLILRAELLELCAILRALGRDFSATLEEVEATRI